MSARTAPYLDAIAHLPPGATLVVPGVSWDEYERLLHDLEDRPGVRISYDDGTLEVMSPSAEHEEYKEFVLRVAQACADALGLPLETRGSTTWKRGAMRQGVEPDTCFYVASAHRIIGRRQIDLDTDPPPDIVVEIDVSNESLRKLPAYAALGVQEIWRYDGKQVLIYALVGRDYKERPGSRFLPCVTVSLLQDSLDLSKSKGQTNALNALRDRLRGSKPDA